MEIYTVHELAELLDLQQKTVRCYLHEGVFKGNKLARKRRGDGGRIRRLTGDEAA